MIRMYVLGLSILVVAILANAVAGYFQWKTWYDLLQGMLKEGMGYCKTLGVMDCLWLFVLYPLILGAAAYYPSKWFSW